MGSPVCAGDRRREPKAPAQAADRTAAQAAGHPEAAAGAGRLPRSGTPTRAAGEAGCGPPPPGQGLSRAEAGTGGGSETALPPALPRLGADPAQAASASGPSTVAAATEVPDTSPRPSRRSSEAASSALAATVRMALLSAFSTLSQDAR